MNDRYLFRGKHINTGEWLFGDLSHAFGDGVYIFPPDAFASVDNYHVAPDTIGQCTGLYDKNGTLIFEGDALKILTLNDPDFNKICVVRFGEYQHINAQNNYPNGDLGFYVYVEVVGNIHDNPGPLEVGDTE